MDSHSYTEYAFWLGSLSFDQLLEECGLHGIELGHFLYSSEELRTILLENHG